MTENVEASNAKEEIAEIVEKCNFCGLCKELDPVFRATRDEAQSARGKAILFSEGIFDDDVFNLALSGSCKASCPFKIDIDKAVRKARQIMNIIGRENEKNREMLDRILNKKGPYAD